MIFTLALRNLFYDRVRFLGTLIGIGFAIVLVTVQLGLYISFSQQITSMIDHSAADLWVVPKGTKSFEESTILQGGERALALSVDGVAEVVPLVVGFHDWHKPNGETALIVLIGTDPARGGLAPWKFAAGSVADLATPDGVIVDRTYLEELGITGVGEQVQIERRMARIVALSDGIRAFTTTPYVFAMPDMVRRYLYMGGGDMTHLMVRVTPGSDVIAVRDGIAEKLQWSEVLTSADFANRSRDHWLFTTGAGFALLAGATLGVIVGTVIVAQTLYSSTKDHLSEFATLRAIGSTARYIHRVILCQALISAVVGFSAAALVGLAIMWLTADSVLPVVITAKLLLLLLVLTVGMCVVSAMAAISKVTRIDPAVVFAS